MKLSAAGPDRDLDLRVMLAALGALALAIAYALGALASGLGHCLQAADAPLHCPLCYAAAILFAAAISPWPRRRPADAAA